MFNCAEYGDFNVSTVLQDKEKFSSYSFGWGFIFSFLCFGYFDFFHNLMKREASKERGSLSIYLFFNVMLEMSFSTNWWFWLWFFPVPGKYTARVT